MTRGGRVNSRTLFDVGAGRGLAGRGGAGRGRVRATGADWGGAQRDLVLPPRGLHRRRLRGRLRRAALRPPGLGRRRRPPGRRRRRARRGLSASRGAARTGLRRPLRCPWVYPVGLSKFVGPGIALRHLARVGGFAQSPESLQPGPCSATRRDSDNPASDRVGMDGRNAWPRCSGSGDAGSEASMPLSRFSADGTLRGTVSQYVRRRPPIPLSPLCQRNASAMPPSPPPCTRAAASRRGLAKHA